MAKIAMPRGGLALNKALRFLIVFTKSHGSAVPQPARMTMPPGAAFETVARGLESCAYINA